MINVLEDLGYKTDSSIPSYFYGRDFLPYRPSREDWTKEGDSKVLEVPVFYNTAAGEGGSNRQRDQWPMLRLKGAEWFSNLSRKMLKKVKDHAGDSVVCVYLHPWEFVEMSRRMITTEVSLTFKPLLNKNCGSFTVDALDSFIGNMKEDDVEFVTMAEYTAGYCKDSSRRTAHAGSN
jgi:hypothetical protein